MNLLPPFSHLMTSLRGAKSRWPSGLLLLPWLFLAGAWSLPEHLAGPEHETGYLVRLDMSNEPAPVYTEPDPDHPDKRWVSFSESCGAPAEFYWLPLEAGLDFLRSDQHLSWRSGSQPADELRALGGLYVAPDACTSRVLDGCCEHQDARYYYSQANAYPAEGATAREIPAVDLIPEDLFRTIEWKQNECRFRVGVCKVTANLCRCTGFPILTGGPQAPEELVLLQKIWRIERPEIESGGEK